MYLNRVRLPLAIELSVAWMPTTLSPRVALLIELNQGSLLKSWIENSPSWLVLPVPIRVPK